VLVLSLDTTTRAGSIAVVDGERVLSEILGDPSRTHGERLPVDLMRALDAASIPPGALDLLAVAAGPGSFTGIRVGIAAIQGLAMATERGVVAVSALDALASAGADGRSAIAAWMDAQRGQVFAALYDERAARVLVEPTACSPTETLDAWAALGYTPGRFIGDGAVRYAETIRKRLGPAEILAQPALAGIIGRFAARFPERATPPHAVVPIYIRKPDAELARDKRHG
jgi:tRNA threonylcarbamoyladenosine biosynthesis protein TsaB